MTWRNRNGNDDERDVALGSALRSLRPVLSASDVDRLTARIMAAQKLVTSTWWAVTANWARVAVPMAAAAGLIIAAAVSQLPEPAETATVATLGVISRDSAVASLESMSTPTWMLEETVAVLERAR